MLILTERRIIMIVKTNPQFITNGHWDKGYYLDRHVVHSEYLGDDAYGHPRFDNEYSEIGRLLYEFKYRNNYSCLENIVDTAVDFIKKAFSNELSSIETIIPVPPTNKFRNYQPTFEIANSIADKLGKYYVEDVLENKSNIESKSLDSHEKNKLDNCIVKRINATRKHSVLLIDDLLKSGSTLNQCVDVLREDPLIDKIYVLSITKTKNS